jgi:hypothetical protein
MLYPRQIHPYPDSPGACVPPRPRSTCRSRLSVGSPDKMLTTLRLVSCSSISPVRSVSQCPSKHQLIAIVCKCSDQIEGR